MRQPLTGAILALAIAAGGPPALAQQSTTPGDDRAAFGEQVRAYLLENPEILVEMLALLEERQQAGAAAGEEAAIADNAAALFDDGFSWVGGNPEGSVTIVEFSDYQCGFCRRAHPEVQELVQSDGDIRLIVKEMPILGPGSDLAARAAVAALMEEGDDAYARLNDALMTLEGPVTEESLDRALRDADLDIDAIRERMEDPEIARRLDETGALAQELGISGTPTFVFGDRMLRGYVPMDGMRELVAELRTEQ